MKHRLGSRLIVGSFTVCVIILVLLVISNKSGNSVKPLCKNCNVVLISLDTLSANHLSCYGYKRETAPYMCSFAQKNTLFRNMFANSNTTLPSHVSMFTGLYPSNHKVNLANVDVLSPKLPFLPEILQNNGYSTHFYFTLTDPSNLPVDKVFYKGINTITSAGHPRDWKQGLDMLDKNNVKGQKTFLFLHSYWVHSPYILERPDIQAFGDNTKKEVIPTTWNALTACTPEYISYLKDAIKEDLDNVYWGGEDDSIYTDLYKELSQIKKEDVSKRNELCTNSRYGSTLFLYYRAYYSYLLRFVDVKDAHLVADLYDSKIKELDTYIKDTVSHILNTKLKENTVIVITSDHGEEFMEHGEWEHGKNLYDSSLKVPLMLYIPGYKGGQMDVLAQSVDILPTILSIVGLPLPFKTDGKDLFAHNTQKIYAIAEKTIDSMKTIRDD